jgi:hypothetical protein
MWNLKMEEKIVKKYAKLHEACMRYPEIQLLNDEDRYVISQIKSKKSYKTEYVKRLKNDDDDEELMKE